MRKNIVLKILKEAGRPLRPVEIWERCNEYKEFYKVGGEEFWYQDMATLLKNMKQQGLITTAYLPTKKGLKVISSGVDTTLFWKRRARLCYFRMRWGMEEAKTELQEILQRYPQFQRLLKQWEVDFACENGLADKSTFERWVKRRLYKRIQYAIKHNIEFPIYVTDIYKQAVGLEVCVKGKIYKVVCDDYGPRVVR